MNFRTIAQFHIIAQWSKKFIGNSITQRMLARRIGDLLRSLDHPVSIHSDTDSDLDKNTVVVSAEYEVDRDESGKRQYIGLTLIVHPKSVKKITFDEQSAAVFAIEILEALCHEYRHEHQYRSRDFEEDVGYRSTEPDYEIRKQQEYLGIPGEIDAFAVNIAIRLWLVYGDRSSAKLSDKMAFDYNDSPDLWGYFHAFGYNHPVSRRLVRKISKNLYQLNDWKSECIKSGAMSEDQLTFQSVPSGSASYNFKQAISE